MGIARSSNELIVCVHQDDWLPADWDRLILNQYRMAERQFGPIGVAGVYGVGPVADGSSNSSRDWPHGLTAQRIEWVEDRGRVLSEGPGLPAPVSTLGELLLIIRKKEQDMHRNRDSTVRTSSARLNLEKEQDMHRNRGSTVRTSPPRLTRDEWAAASEADLPSGRACSALDGGRDRIVRRSERGGGLIGCSKGRRARDGNPLQTALSRGQPPRFAR